MISGGHDHPQQPLTERLAVRSGTTQAAGLTRSPRGSRCGPGSPNRAIIAVELLQPLFEFYGEVVARATPLPVLELLAEQVQEPERRQSPTDAVRGGADEFGPAVTPQSAGEYHDDYAGSKQNDLKASQRRSPDEGLVMPPSSCAGNYAARRPRRASRPPRWPMLKGSMSRPLVRKFARSHSAMQCSTRLKAEGHATEHRRFSEDQHRFQRAT